MNDADRQTRSYLMDLFAEHGFHPRSDLGQNFLIDLNLVEFIVDEARIKENDVVLEIGAGTGGMTTYLSAQAAAVVSVELDTNMYGLVSKVVEPFENVTLLNCDALRNKNNLSDEVLKTVEEKLAEGEKRTLKLVSNLPYNIATPVISNLVATDLPWERMIVTIQLELGQRMVARPGRSQYGALSIWLQSQCRVKILKKLGPKVFWPRPGVESAIVQLVPNKRGREAIADRPFLQDYARRLFTQRRKMLRSVVVGMYRKQLEKQTIDALLEELGVEPTARAEEMSVKDHVRLANRLHAAIENMKAVAAAT